MSIQHLVHFRKLRMLEHLILVLLVIALLAAISLPAFAAAPPITFGASITNANGELSTALTWDAPGASGCVGSGHESWNGEKLASGTQQLPTITLSGTYSLTLTCTFPGDTSARVSWTAPTHNTDGTPLTNLAGFRILYGTSPTLLTQSVSIDNPAVTSRNITELTEGTWYFAAMAVNELGVPSALSNVASKVITAASTQTSAISLTVNPVPLAPDVSVE